MAVDGALSHQTSRQTRVHDGWGERTGWTRRGVDRKERSRCETEER